MSHVSLGVSKAKNSKSGSFVAIFYEEGKTKKSKTVSLDVMDAQIAYETVDLWAEDKAKEMNCPYQKSTFEQLSHRLATAVSGTLRKGHTIGPTKDKHTTKSNLGNIKFFKMEMRRAFKDFTADKIREVIKEGSKLLNELQREKLKVERNSGKAKADIAKAMYLTFVDTGVDATQWCTDSEIINEFNRLRIEGDKLL